MIRDITFLDKKFVLQDFLELFFLPPTTFETLISIIILHCYRNYIKECSKNIIAFVT